MNSALRHAGRASVGLLALTTLGTAIVAGTVPAALAAAAPAAPADLELHAASDSSITLEWPASAGATQARPGHAPSLTARLGGRDETLNQTCDFETGAPAVNATADFVADATAGKVGAGTTPCGCCSCTTDPSAWM